MELETSSIHKIFLICFFYNICYAEEPAFEGTSNRQSASIPFSQSSEYGITVFPNPAAEYVVFSVVDNPQIVLSSIQISDMTGKPIYQSNFDSDLKQHIWDTRNISNGNYIYTLVDMSGMKYSGKVTIRHNH